MLLRTFGSCLEEARAAKAIKPLGTFFAKERETSDQEDSENNLNLPDINSATLGQDQVEDKEPQTIFQRN